MQFCPLCKSALDHRLINEEQRLSCTADNCEYIYWNNPVPVVGVIVEHEDEIILANNVNWPDHWYSIITGFLEKGENPEECAVREVKEELDLKTSSLTFVGIYSFYKLNQLIIAYHAHTSGTVVLNEELRHYKRIKKEELKPWESETGHAVRDWLNQTDYSG